MKVTVDLPEQLIKALQEEGLVEKETLEEDLQYLLESVLAECRDLDSNEWLD